MVAIEYVFQDEWMQSKRLTYPSHHLDVVDARDLNPLLSRDVAEGLEIRRRYLEKKRTLRNDLQADFRRLRDLLGESSGTVSEETLKQVLTTIREKRNKLQSLWGEQYDEVSKVLSVRKQAQLMLFLKDFRREIRSLLRPRGLGPPRGPGSGRWRNRPHPPGQGPWEKQDGGIWSGLTDNYTRVWVRSKENLTNRLVATKLVAIGEDGLWGKVVA